MVRDQGWSYSGRDERFAWEVKCDSNDLEETTVVDYTFQYWGMLMLELTEPVPGRTIHGIQEMFQSVASILIPL
jgi:hypothetical protein